MIFKKNPNDANLWECRVNVHVMATITITILHVKDTFWGLKIYDQGYSVIFCRYDLASLAAAKKAAHQLVQAMIVELTRTLNEV